MNKLSTVVKNAMTKLMSRDPTSPANPLLRLNVDVRVTTALIAFCSNDLIVVTSEVQTNSTPRVELQRSA